MPFMFQTPQSAHRPGKPFSKASARAPGSPTFIIVHEGRCYALEFKTEVGRLTKVQAEAIAVLERAGALTAEPHREASSLDVSEFPAVRRRTAIS
jgi:hypothetical protein